MLRLDQDLRVRNFCTGGNYKLIYAYDSIFMTEK